MRGFFLHRGDDFWGAAPGRNVHAAWRLGGAVLIDEGQAAVPPDDAERIEAEDAPGEVRDHLDPF